MKSSTKHIGLVLWLLFLFISFSTSAVMNYYRFNNEPGLYFPEDDVTILTTENFNSSIYRSKTAWFVEFYSNWCGNCQRSAPGYKAFATDVKGWQDLVVVAALDCANEENSPVCEYFRITAYPTFRYIHDDYDEDPSKVALPVAADSHTNYTEQRKNLVNIMRKEQIEGRGKLFPDLQPYNLADVSRMFTDVNQKYGFLIIQEPFDSLGPSLILDFHKVKEAAIKYTFNNESSITTDSLPALFKVDRSGHLNHIKIVSDDSSENDNRLAFRNKIRDILLAAGIEVPSEVLKNNLKEILSQRIAISKEDLELRKKIKEQGDVVFQLDLEYAIRYSLKREVGGNVEIQEEKLKALRQYIDVLVKYFPFNSKGTSLLNEIRQYVNSNSIISGKNISGLVKNVESPNSGVFSGPPQWLGCKGSTPTKRGYPCGLWKLFHYMTVNAAFDPTNTKDSNPRIVLEAMHGYIKNFFGCEDCSEHFQEMAARNNIFNVSSFEESVLWLWSAHNEVNKRLAGDATEDPEFPKVAFPTKEKCSRCWKDQKTAAKDEILNYLKQMYARENIRYLGVSSSAAAFASNLLLSCGGLLLSVLFFMR